MSVIDFPPLPDFLKRPRDHAAAREEWAREWHGVRVTRRPKIFAESKVIDSSTAAFIAEQKKRAQEAEAKRQLEIAENRRIGLKKRTRTLAVNRATAQINQQLPTDGDDDMAKKAKKRTAKNPREGARQRATKTLDRAIKRAGEKAEKQVTPRFKTSTGKKADVLKKPRPERAPRRSQRTPAEIIADAHRPNVYQTSGKMVLSKNGREKIEAAGLDPAKVIATETAQADAKPAKISKGAQLEAMLRKGLVSAAEIAEQLGWLPHTTRAAISRVGYEVSTEKKDGVTLYHIAANAKAKDKLEA